MANLISNPACFRHLVGIARASSTQDASGQPVNTWTPYLTVKAEIKQLSGQELFQSDQFTAAAQVRISFRWPGAAVIISTGDRVFFSSHVYVAQIVDNVELRNILVNLTCLEIDGAA